MVCYGTSDLQGFLESPTTYHPTSEMSNRSPLDIAILRTLAYYDVFAYSLTVHELWRWLWPDPAQPRSSFSEEDVRKALDGEGLREAVTMTGEMVTLRGREANVASRADRLADNQKKWKRAESAARFLELVPFVKMVAVANTLAINNARPDSDIDFFIVTSRQHIWIARFLVTGIVSLLGWRRHGTKIKNRICLSFYVSSAALDLSPMKSADQDPHFTFWAAQLVPLMVDADMYRKYATANSWVTAVLPNAFTPPPQRLLIPNNSLRSIKRFYELFFSNPIGLMIENWTRTRQLKKMEANVTTRANENTTDVIISEDVLKFHEADRRAEYNAAVARRLAELGL